MENTTADTPLAPSHFSGDRFRGTFRSGRRPYYFVLIFLVFCLFVSGVGCGTVNKTITVETEPEGAHVYLDRSYAGEAPVEIPFQYYGVREIRVDHPGYRPETMEIHMSPPFHQVFPVNFGTELLPVTTGDHRTYQIHLTPSDRVERDEIKTRARQLQDQLQAEENDD